MDRKHMEVSPRRPRARLKKEGAGIGPRHRCHCETTTVEGTTAAGSREGSRSSTKERL